MNYGPDPFEFHRLQEENRVLLEQCRTLAARLNDKHPSGWIVALPSGKSMRPATETAYSRQYVADEVLASVEPAVIWGHLGERLQRSIEHLATEKSVTSVDGLWRLTMERDFLKTTP